MTYKLLIDVYHISNIVCDLVSSIVYNNLTQEATGMKEVIKKDKIAQL